MSGKLRLNGATSGYIELQAEDEANNSTLTISNTGFGGGKVLQVIQSVKTDAEAITTGFSWADIDDMSVTITPSATTSKIFVMADFCIGLSNGYDGKVRLYRGSTHIYKGDDTSSYVSTTKRIQPYSASYDDYKIDNVAINFLDSPNTTSATTYKLQGAAYGSVIMYINRTHTMNAYKSSGYDGYPASSITAWEIGA